MPPALLPDRRRWLSFLVVIGIMASALVSVVQPARAVDAAPGLTVTMTAEPSVIYAPGQLVTYQVLISNQTSRPLVVSSATFTNKVVSECGLPGRFLPPRMTVVCTAMFVTTSADILAGQVRNVVAVIAIGIIPEFEQTYSASAAVVIPVGVGSAPPTSTYGTVNPGRTGNGGTANDPRSSTTRPRPTSTPGDEDTPVEAR